MADGIDRGARLERTADRAPAAILRLEQLLQRLPRPSIAVLTIALLTLVFLLDVRTGPEIAFSIFYLVPVAIATWYLGGVAAVATLVLAGAGWLAADVLANATYTHEGIRYWNALVRFSLFCVVAYTLNALRNSLFHERALARTDALTGMPNSRYFLELARREVQRARRYHHPITVCYLDLDGFKEINDQRGHADGDELLRLVAQGVVASCREIDVVARLGGDEFVMLLPQADATGAKVVITRLNNELAALRAAGWNVAYSVGVATFMSPPETAEEMVRAADRLMYSVKASGGGVRYASIAANAAPAPAPFGFEE